MIDALRTGSWLDRARTRRIAGLSMLLVVAAIGFFAATAHGTLDFRGRPLGSDFSQVYAAGRMAWAGHAPDVWDWPKHFAAQLQVHHAQRLEVYGWHYPPPFLLVASALALLPYLPALVAWQAVTLGALLALANRATGLKDGWIFVVAAPTTAICLMHGQNAFLTTLLLGGGLLLLDRRPFVAGLLLGCLVYKPQFALLLPPLLFIARKWPALLGAAVSSLALVALTTAIWGWPVWQAFLDSLPLTREVIVEQGRTGWEKIVSPFSAARGAGLGIAPAYAIQTLCTLGSIGLTLWLARKARPDVRNAAAMATAVIATPYVLDYDLVVLLGAIAFLWRDGEHEGWRPWDKTLLGIAWLAPLFGRAVTHMTHVPLGLATSMMLLVLAVRRGLTASPSRRSHEGSGR